MLSVLADLPRSARVAVIRLRSLGDCVLTVPALSILKNFRPDVGLAVVAEDRFAPVFEGNPDVAAILPPEVSALRTFRPRLCLNLHGGRRSLILSLASGAKLRAGFAHFRYPWAYHIRIPRAQEILGADRKVHTAEHLASAVFYLGAPQQEVPPARLCAQPWPAAPPYVVIHPCASEPAKTWPAERFCELARKLRSETGCEPVFIGAASDDLSAFSGYRTVQGASLAKVKSLVSGASLFVGNDSGPAHIAAAFGVPVVVLFGSSDAVVWAPWKTPSEVLVAPGGDMRALSMDQVLAAAGRLRVAA
jgi:heptosyltransferase III